MKLVKVFVVMALVGCGGLAPGEENGVAALALGSRNEALGTYSCTDALQNNRVYTFTAQTGITWSNVTWTSSGDWMDLTLWQPIPANPTPFTMALTSSMGGLGGTIAMHRNADGSFSNTMDTNIWVVRQASNAYVPGWFVLRAYGLWISPPGYPDASHPNGMMVLDMDAGPYPARCANGISHMRFVIYL